MSLVVNVLGGAVSFLHTCPILQWLENCKKTFGDKEGGQQLNTQAQVWYSDLREYLFVVRECVCFEDKGTFGRIKALRLNGFVIHLPWDVTLKSAVRGHQCTPLKHEGVILASYVVIHQSSCLSVSQRCWMNVAQTSLSVLPCSPDLCELFSPSPQFDIFHHITAYVHKLQSIYQPNNVVVYSQHI